MPSWIPISRIPRPREPLSAVYKDLEGKLARCFPTLSFGRGRPLSTIASADSKCTSECCISMREAAIIEYFVFLMTDSHPAALKVLHGSLRYISCSRVSGPEEETWKRTRRGSCAHDVHMIPSPIHFLAHSRPFRPVVEPRGAAGGSNYNPLVDCVFAEEGVDGL